LQLIATTVKILFQKENTEGVEQWQRTASTAGVRPENAAQNDLVQRGQTGAASNSTAIVSVIIPACSCADTIGRAIDSALAQDVPLEILVINDNSPDDLDTVMEQYRTEPRIKYFKNESSMGAAATRNRGVQMARGNYVAFLDADDWWGEDKLKKQLAILTTGEAAPVLCSTARELVTYEGELTGHVILVHETITYRRLLLHNCINCSSVVLRTDVAREFPMEHEDSHEDYITWLRVLKKYGQAAAVNEPLLKYRLTASGKSGGKLHSARMTYRAYRYAGFGRAASACLFCAYAVNGVLKYSAAFLSRWDTDESEC
ncbi:MAG: glycosyltransferase, partial [Lachnospiraceae bacterium]|nr:glycosyltransferase [Lachnospiraceae bacterium]